MNRPLRLAVMSTVLLTSMTFSSGVMARPSSDEIFTRDSLRVTRRDRSNPIANFQEVLLPRGTRIRVEHDKEKLFVAPSGRLPLTLIVRDDVVRSNRLVIPAGSRIEGELRPAADGSRFVAQTLVFRNGQRYAIEARSNVVTRRETVRQNPKLGRVLTGAGIGAVASAILAGITGDRKIDALEVLGGAAIGSAGSYALSNRQTEMISIRPNEDLTLELRSDLAFR
ncbi:hypothetical protein ACQ4M3_39400 [Leptolyngbya sp. AN03gr2]|uniref:hypothetical protein n=1 Tax=unclassified Leptolyngbya TaxID=2650499 RepID=UPI003D31AA40